MKTFEYLVIVALRIILRRLINPSNALDMSDYTVWVIHAGVFLEDRDNNGS